MIYCNSGRLIQACSHNKGKAEEQASSVEQEDKKCMYFRLLIGSCLVMSDPEISQKQVPHSNQGSEWKQICPQRSH